MKRCLDHATCDGIADRFDETRAEIGQLRAENSELRKANEMNEAKIAVLENLLRGAVINLPAKRADAA